MRIYLRDVLRQTVLPEARASGPARLRAEKGYSLSEREYPLLFLPSAALLIFRAAVQRKKCRMAARSPLTRQPLVCRVSAGYVRYRPQHCFYFFPLPQGQGSLRPIFCTLRGCFFTLPSPAVVATMPSATRSRLTSASLLMRAEKMRRTVSS